MRSTMLRVPALEKSAICDRDGYNSGMSIRLLSPETASQIAAGEVVERLNVTQP